MPNRDVTIREVASLAGVSTSTASYALRGDSRISEDTRNRVCDAASQLNYVKSVPASQKEKRNPKIIGLFLHDTAGAFFTSVIHSVKSILDASRYELYIHLGEQITLYDWLDGAIIYNNEIPDARILELADSGIPIILMDRELEDHRLKSVVLDNFSGMYQITNEVLRHGCERIAYIGGASHYYDSNRRYDGYKQALADAGKDLSDMIFVRGDCRYESGFQAASFIHASKGKPDAYICSNDEMAVGVIDYYRSIGTAGDDFPVITGFDGITTHPRESYNFMTVYPQNWGWGATAAYSILEMIEHKSKNAETILFPVAVDDIQTAEKHCPN